MGKQLVQGITELILVLVDCAIIIATDVINAFANFFDYINPERNGFTRAFINVLIELTEVGKNCAYALANAFGTFLENGGQAFLNVMGDIIMLVGTILGQLLVDAISLITAFVNSWLGTAVISTVAITLDVIAGAIKAVLIVIKELLPVIELLGITFGALALAKIASDFTNTWTAIGQGAVPLNSMKTLGGQLANKLGTLKANAILTKDAFVKFIKDGAKAAIEILKKLGTSLLDTTKKLASFILKLAIHPIATFKAAVAPLIASLKTMGTALKDNIVSLGQWALAMGRNAITAIGNAIVSMGTYVASLVGLTVAEGAATAGATALGVALSAIGIGLLITGLVLLIKNLDKVGAAFKWVGNCLADFWNWLKKIPIIGGLFKGIEWIIKGIGDALSWIWKKIKEFFGWDSENKPKDELDKTKDSAEEAGEEIEDLGEKITITAERFGTASSTINRHLSELQFPGSIMAEQAEAATNSMTEKFEMMSGKTQEYLQAIADGDQEALANMEIDTAAAMEELKAMYNDLSTEERNQFVATYGFISGLTDEWSIENAESYTDAVSKHIAYCESILADEKLTYEEKQRLMEEDKAALEKYYEDSIATIKNHRDERLSQEGLTHDEIYRIQYEADQELRALEAERKGYIINNLKDVEDARITSNNTIVTATAETAEAQKEALSIVDTALETTKTNINSLVTETGKAAKAIPEQWTNVGNAITKEFDQVKVNVAKTMGDCVNSVKKGASNIASTMNSEFNKVRTNTASIFDNIKSSMSNSMNDVVNNISRSLANITNSFSTSFEKVKSTVITCLNNINGKVSEITGNMNNTVTSNISTINNSFNTGFSNISTTVGNKLNSVNTTIRNSMNNVVNTMRSAVSTLQSVWNNMSFATKTPYLKMPHIQVWGAFDMSTKPPRVPEFSVKVSAI